ncbi:MAG: polysaccharide deacetylase family protein [Propionibacteriaceae bacterium]|nr:polysaccharide deacetylase family protein [Propionibacteriaceae bacterium]
MATDATPSETKSPVMPTEATPTAQEGPWLQVWLQANGKPNELPILMYHYVRDSPPDSNTITPEALESDFKALHDLGYTTVSSDEAIRILTTNEKPSNKMVWLTFDDGQDTFYTEVYPRLKKYGLHATSFIITSNVQKGLQGTLSVDQIKEMKASGLADFQSHTVSHPDLSTASDATQTKQLGESKAYLDQLLGQDTVVICYPSGSHNRRTADIAEGLGYKAGVLDPGRTYLGKTAQEVPAISTTGMFLLNRYRTFSDMDADAMMKKLAAAEDYNTKNTAVD